MDILKSVTLAYDLIWEKSKESFGIYKNVKFKLNIYACKHCKRLTIKHKDTELYINYCSKCGNDDIDTSNIVQSWKYK